MAQLASQPLPLCAHSPCALPPTALIMGRKSPPCLLRSSPLHEPLAVGQGQATLGRAAPNRMDGDLADRVSPTTQAAGWPNYSFAFHDNDEVGPGLLAQIAKKTGLKSEDL